MNKRIINITFLLLFTLLLSASEQEVEQTLHKFDSLQTVSNANDFMSALYANDFVDELVVYSSDAKSGTLKYYVWYWAAEWYIDKQQYKVAVEYGNKALQYLNFLEDESQQADLYNILAIANIRLGLFDEAAVYARECYNYDLETGNADNISSSLNLLASIYMCTRQFDEAKKYIDEAISYAEKSGNKNKIAIVKGTASEIYHRCNQNDISLSYATEAYELDKQMGRADKAAIRQSQRASALISLGRYDEAEEALLQEAIPVFRENGNRHSLAISCNQMGILKHLQGQDSVAVEYYNEALEIFTNQEDIFNLCQTHRLLQDALRNINPSLALYHGDIYNSLRDSLYDSQTGVLLSKYAAEYDNYHLQQVNEHLRHSSRNLIFLIVAFVLLVCVFTPIFYHISRCKNRRRQEKLLAEIAALQKQLLKENTNDISRLTDDITAEQRHETQISESDQLFLKELLQAINTAPQNNLSVENMAEMFNMTPQTFRRRVVKITGEQPSKFINAVQMQKAGAVITENPSMSVSEVAMICGFDEISTFSRSFKRFYGVSPTDYRKQTMQ